MSALLGICLEPPSAREGDKSQARMCTRVLMAGFSWQVFVSIQYSRAILCLKKGGKCCHFWNFYFFSFSKMVGFSGARRGEAQCSQMR